MSPSHLQTTAIKGLVRGGGVLVRLSVATAIGLTLFSIGVAQQSSAAIKMLTNIPAQPLGTALQALAQQRDFQIVYVDEELQAVRTAGAAGELTPEEAIRKLLDGTGFTFRYLDEKTVTIVPPGQTPAAPPTTGDSAASSRLDLEEVVVTGTHIRGTEPIGSKVLVIGREQIESGYGKLQDFTETLTQNFSGIGEDFSQSGTSNLTRGTEIQLRGLGPGTTLTLINGQRQAPGGSLSAFVDISSIPTSAIERVEILPDGASAIYGSDAVGGVVNIVLRDDLDGAETSVRMGSAGGDADDIQLGQLVGTRWESGRAIVGYQYSRRDALLYGSRDYLAANGDLRPFGGTDRRRDLRSPSPGNIVSAAGAVLYAIPQGQDGTDLTAADLLPNQTNYYDTSTLTILPEQEIHSAFLNAKQSFGDRVEIELGARFAERDSLLLLGGSQTTVSVPSTNPFYVNPQGGTAPVRVEYDFSNDFGGPVKDTGHSRTYAASLAGTIRLTERWDLRTSGSYGEESVFHMRTNQRDSAAISAAVADTNPATALNVFGDGSANNPATIARIRVDRSDETTTSVWSVGMIADGPLFSFNGRDVQLAVGADRHGHRYHLDSTFEIAGETRSERNVSSAFAELAIPLLGGDTASGASRLELSLAGRFDDYDDFGSTFNPKAGLKWQPFDALRVRGTWGTSFRAPPFYLSNGDIRPTDLSVSTLNDPAAPPPGRTRVLTRSGVIPGLKEETAEVWTAGLDITPFADLSVSLTYFDIAYQDKIQAGAAVPATVLTFESQFAGTGIIIRNPTQAQLDAICTPEFASDCAGGPFGAIVDFRLRNVAEVNTSGLDLSASYAFDTRLGKLNVGLEGTYTFNYEEAVTKIAPELDFVDTLGRPLSLRLRGAFGWSFGGWRVNTGVAYAGSYEDPTTRRAIDSWTTVDLSAGYEFGSTSGWASGLRALVAATNVLDESPPFVDRLPAFDGANSSITGRTVSFHVVKQWGQE
jgi:iron complex outermembrane recepter protein